MISVPEHDAQICWTGFSPLLGSLSSELRSRDLTRVEARLSPVPLTHTHTSEQLVDRSGSMIVLKLKKQSPPKCGPVNLPKSGHMTQVRPIKV